LHYDFILKQISCIYVSISSLFGDKTGDLNDKTGDKIMICYNHSVNVRKYPI